MSPPRPFEDLIHLSVSGQRATLDCFLVTEDFYHHAVGFRRVAHVYKALLFGLNNSEVGLLKDFDFLVCSDESEDLTDTLSASLYSL